MAALLELVNVSKHFGRIRAVDSVSLSVEPGELYGFLGPNGAGKTTTIRMIVGLIRPDAGTIRIAGFDAQTQHVAAARHFGAIVESPGLFGYLSARANLEQWGRMLGHVDPGEIRDLLELVGLSDRADERVSGYSLGMRQRLGIAQALLGSPELLILDEPTNGLDPAGIREVRGLLRRLARERHMGVFVSSHLLAEVEELCDRVAVIQSGKVRVEAPVAELTRAPGWRVLVTVSDVDQARKVLGGVDGVEVTQGPEPRVLDVRADTDLGRTVLRRLVESGVDVDEMRLVTRSLEQAFLELTGDMGAEAPLPRAAAGGQDA